jgi:hypothetical protein
MQFRLQKEKILLSNSKFEQEIQKVENPNLTQELNPRTNIAIPTTISQVHSPQPLIICLVTNHDAIVKSRLPPHLTTEHLIWIEKATEDSH